MNISILSMTCISVDRLQVKRERQKENLSKTHLILILLLIYLFIPSILYSFIHSFIHPSICSSFHSSILQFFHSFIDSFIHYSFIHSFFYTLFIHSFIHLFIRCLRRSRTRWITSPANSRPTSSLQCKSILITIIIITKLDASEKLIKILFALLHNICICH